MCIRDSRYVNAGKIRNTGIELTVEGTPFMNENFRWKTALNMSMNRNKVVSLHKDYKSFRYGSEGFSMAYDKMCIRDRKAVSRKSISVQITKVTTGW